MGKVIRGEGLGKEKEDNKVRTWDSDKSGMPVIQFKNQ